MVAELKTLNLVVCSSLVGTVELRSRSGEKPIIDACKTAGSQSQPDPVSKSEDGKQVRFLRFSEARKMLMIRRM